MYRALSSDIEVSVLIPSTDGDRGGNVAELLNDLESQDFQNIEIIVIVGVSPQGKAINQGVSRAEGQILVILDDDSRLPSTDSISSLVKVLHENSDIGMVGASIRQPSDANCFQKLAAREFPRFSMEVVNTVTDSDMPCHGCCAFHRRVFEEIGGERESIVRGLDPDLRQRLRDCGLRVVLAPGTVAFHPLPATVNAMIRMFFRNGRGSAYAQRHSPELVYGTDEKTLWQGRALRHSLAGRAFRYPFRSLYRLCRGHFIRFFGDFVYIAGYLAGMLATENSSTVLCPQEKEQECRRPAAGGDPDT